MVGGYVMPKRGSVTYMIMITGLAKNNCRSEAIELFKDMRLTEAMPFCTGFTGINIVACEDRDRLERHKRFGMWSESMEQGGYRCTGINNRTFSQLDSIKVDYYHKFQVEKQEHNDGYHSALTSSWLH
ncbi:hypothetical protein POM88_052730 [Heracleum sosnowskyi]|uniref:Pentatricopeptide repeat-containing protein n=1 Tax=Heracleum sosnowskyi TaxID=360622 RepID=A0AAD8LY80_9APIA|nr:hypothetical protein POM88_052730 [Heracleum sosnowskyi]